MAKTTTKTKGVVIQFTERAERQVSVFVPQDTPEWREKAAARAREYLEDGGWEVDYEEEEILEGHDGDCADIVLGKKK